MNILSVFVSFTILLKCVHASGNTFGAEFRGAVEWKHYKWLNANRKSWKGRKDLLDYVIRNETVVTVWFIQFVEGAEGPVFAALFDKGEKEMIDGVLGGVINYSRYGLCFLTDYRPELAGSPEKFFRILDKLIDPEMQELAVRHGVKNLFKAGKHESIAPLVDALGKRALHGDRLKGEAIQSAFYKGTKSDQQDIVGLCCEHPAITPRRYADGLNISWNNGKPKQVFPFLLWQADQGDLEAAKKTLMIYKRREFHQAIDKAFEVAPPAGSRHRPIERDKQRAKLAMNALDTALGTKMWHQGPGNIIASYLVAEAEWTEGTGRMKPKKGETETSRIDMGKKQKACMIQ